MSTGDRIYKQERTKELRTGLAPARAPGISSLQRGELAMLGGGQRDTRDAIHRKRHRVDTETSQKRRIGRERFHSNLGAQWRRRLQPDQSRRWSSGLIGDRGAGMRLGGEGRSPRTGALVRLTRTEGKRLLLLFVLPFSLSLLLSKMASLRQSKAAPFIVQGAAVTNIKVLSYQHS